MAIPIDMDDAWFQSLNLDNAIDDTAMTKPFFENFMISTTNPDGDVITLPPNSLDSDDNDFDFSMSPPASPTFSSISNIDSQATISTITEDSAPASHISLRTRRKRKGTSTNPTKKRANLPVISDFLNWRVGDIMIMTRNDTSMFLVLVTRRIGVSVTGKVLSPLLDGSIGDSFLDIDSVRRFDYNARPNTVNRGWIYSSHSFRPIKESGFYMIPPEMKQFLARDDLEIRNRSVSRYSDVFHGFIKSSKIDCDGDKHAALLTTHFSDLIN